jgi:hypothetical protein
MVAFLLTACNPIIPVDRADPAPRDDIDFIDLDTFDASISSNMRKRTELLAVNFPNQPVSINEIPSRLQRWLSAVHKYGGGITVETEDGLVRKDLLTVVGVMVSGYQLAKQYLPVLTSQRYKAVIVLENSDGRFSRVEFIRE